MKLQTTGEDPKVLQKSDKKALQNYGRPYKSHQAPAGSYYSHAKEPKNLKPWPPAPEKVRTQPNAEKLLKKSDSDEKHDAKIQRFLSQPFQVAEVFTGHAGKLVTLEQTIEGFTEILAGKYDHLPEVAFYMVGDISEVEQKAERLAAEAAN